MTENYHHVQLTIEHGELHHRFVCTAPENAPCRRRPPDADQRESWTAAEATIAGHPCWAVEWVDAVGIEDAIRGTTDGVLASVPVTIGYDEGVEITPVVAEEPEPDEYAGSRVPPPPRLLVDALGYVWQDGAAPGFLSMARTTDRNLPSPGLIEYRPISPRVPVEQGDDDAD